MKDTSRKQLKQLRSLRRRVEVLNDQLRENLEPFQHLNDLTFVHSPKSKSKLEDEKNKDTVDVATTATVLMAVSMRDAYLLAGDGFFASKSVQSLEKLYNKDWASAGLEEGNFFTTALTLRATGFLQQSASAFDLGKLKHGDKAPQDLLQAIASEDPKDRKIDKQSNYPITPALAYWLMDAAQRLSVDLEGKVWEAWIAWASREFRSQLTNVVANDDAAMDPIALAMSACLIAKIRGIAADGKMSKFPHGIEQALPTREHLRTAISMLFKFQGRSGIWPKYFPLFIYPQGREANHCFTFELLEAVLSEFYDEIVDTPHLLSRIETSVGWCEKNRLRYANEEGRVFWGWNSGSNLEGLRQGRPECWATAVIHMFLSKLHAVLTARISALLLAEHGDAPEKKRKWHTLLGSHVKLSGGKAQDVKEVLENILRHWEVDPSGKRKDADAISERKRSALLFGPPGTSKTSYIKQLAAEYNWTCVSINPSHFLKDGLEQIFGRANEIFADLMDLSKAVVFFDEMDPLVQRREADSDIHHQSLTTVLLPKLADLYKRNNVAFFMATNHIQQIDPAIRRPGRFDYLLFVGPPRWQDKYRALTMGTDDKKFATLPKDEQDWKRSACELLTEWTTDWRNDPQQDVLSTLDRFTYDEMKALFEGIRSGKGDLHAALRDLTKEHFETQAREWGQKYIVLWDREDARSDDYAEYLKDKGSSRG